MGAITDEEWRNLAENFDTSELLSCVDRLDEARKYLADGDSGEALDLRTALLELHGLAMDVMNYGHVDQAGELFEKIDDLECQVSEIMDSLEFIQRSLSALSELYPESLLHDEDEDD